MGRLRTGSRPCWRHAATGDPSQYADPLPQALVLTAIVISFATTALFLVVLLASRGLTGTDHVDGREPEPDVSRMADHLMIAPVVLPLVAGAAMLLLGERHRNAESRDQRRLDVSRSSASPWPCSECPTQPRRGRGRSLSPWRLAGAVRDRARAGPAVRSDAAPDGHSGVGRRGVLARPLAPRGRAFPFAVPVPADGPQRRLSDRRPLQPVRLFRAAAGRVVWAWRCTARASRACQGRAALHRGQPGGLAAVSDRRQPDLRGFGNAQHGGPRRAHPGHRRGEPGAAGGRRGHSGHRLPAQGGDVAPVLLAADDLCGRERRPWRPSSRS